MVGVREVELRKFENCPEAPPRSADGAPFAPTILSVAGPYLAMSPRGRGVGRARAAARQASAPNRVGCFAFFSAEIPPTSPHTPETLTRDFESRRPRCPGHSAVPHSPSPRPTRTRIAPWGGGAPVPLLGMTVGLSCRLYNKVSEGGLCCGHARRERQLRRAPARDARGSCQSRDAGERGRP
jgi:hypothetical protein